MSTIHKDRILVIVPAYNEEESLQHTIELLQQYTREYDTFSIDYVVVNDGSRDATIDICHKNNYSVLDLPLNLGLTAAFQAGMRLALREGYDYAVQLDADGQHDPASLEMLIRAAQESKADIVVGSRFATEKKKPSMRMLGSWLITGLIRLTTGKRIADPTSGYRLYNRKVIKRFAVDANCSPEPDTLAFLMRKGAQVKEVQVTMSDRFGGESYLTAWKSIMYMARICFSIVIFQWVRKG